MNQDVFISHSSKDKTMADAICAGLESRGIRCWITPRDVLPGEEWTRAIVKAITDCKVFLFIFTGNSSTSTQVIKELDCAMNHEKTIIPFRLEDLKPTGSMEYYLGSLHWLDALTPPIEKHIGILADYIGRILEVSQTQLEHSSLAAPAEESKKEILRSSEKPVMKPKSDTKPRKQKKWVWFVGLGIVAAGIITGWVLGSDKLVNKQAATEFVPLAMSSPTNTFTPLPPTLQPNATITPTAVQEILTAILLKNSMCRLTYTNFDSCYVNMTAGQTITILGQSTDGDWINVENDWHFSDREDSNSGCWIYIEDEKIDIRVQDFSVPVITPLPVTVYPKSGEVTGKRKDGSEIVLSCITSTDKDAVILDCETICNLLMTEGGQCLSVRYTSGGTCDH